MPLLWTLLEQKAFITTSIKRCFIPCFAASTLGLIKHSFPVAVTSVGSGVCELTNQSRVGIQEGALNRQDMKQSVSDKRQCCCTGLYEESNYEPENDHNMSPFIACHWVGYWLTQPGEVIKLKLLFKAERWGKKLKQILLCFTIVIFCPKGPLESTKKWKFLVVALNKCSFQSTKCLVLCFKCDLNGSSIV